MALTPFDALRKSIRDTCIKSADAHQFEVLSSGVDEIQGKTSLLLEKIGEEYLPKYMKKEISLSEYLLSIVEKYA